MLVKRRILVINGNGLLQQVDCAKFVGDKVLPDRGTEFAPLLPLGRREIITMLGLKRRAVTEIAYGIHEENGNLAWPR